MKTIGQNARLTQEVREPNSGRHRERRGRVRGRGKFHPQSLTFYLLLHPLIEMEDQTRRPVTVSQDLLSLCVLEKTSGDEEEKKVIISCR